MIFTATLVFSLAAYTAYVTGLIPLTELDLFFLAAILMLSLALYAAQLSQRHKQLKRDNRVFARDCAGLMGTMNQMHMGLLDRVEDAVGEDEGARANLGLDLERARLERQEAAFGTLAARAQSGQLYGLD